MRVLVEYGIKLMRKENKKENVRSFIKALEILSGCLCSLNQYVRNAKKNRYKREIEYTIYSRIENDIIVLKYHNSNI